MPYFKPGDDLNDCIAKDSNGNIYAKETFANYGAMLLNAAEIAVKISDAFHKEHIVDLDVGTHLFDIEGIDGSANIIQRLVDMELAQINEDYDDDGDNGSGQ